MVSGRGWDVCGVGGIVAWCCMRSDSSWWMLVSVREWRSGGGTQMKMKQMKKQRKKNQKMGASSLI